MGIGIFPVFKARVKGAEFDSDGKVLAREFETLDELAAHAGVRRFSSFGDNRDVPADFDGDPEDVDDILGVWDEWFPSAEGLQTVDALLAELSRASENGELVEELRELRRCLQVAADVDVEFRLEMG